VSFERRAAIHPIRKPKFLRPLPMVFFTMAGKSGGPSLGAERGRRDAVLFEKGKSSGQGISGPTSGPGKVAGRFGGQIEARGTPFFLRRESPPVKRLWPNIRDIVAGKSGGPILGAERGDFFPRREGPPAKGSLVDPSPRS
jgi:hypothetical protein